MKKLIATFVACLSAGAAFGQEQIAVDYSDLDVTTPIGASALYRRITNASQEVCRHDSVSGVNGYFLWHSCVRDAIAKAVSDVDSPLVTARYHREAPGRLYSWPHNDEVTRKP